MVRVLVAVTTIAASLTSGCFLSHELDPGDEPPPVVTPPPPTTMPPTTMPPPPVVMPPPPTIPPSTTLEIQARLIAGSLGDGVCDADGDIDCALPPGAGIGCGCLPSNMQIVFTVGEGDGPLAVSILGVALHEDESGSYIQDLDWSRPTAWDDATSMYAPWDERLDAPSEVRTSYTLTPPDWFAIGHPHSMAYRLRVTVDVGGRIFELESPPIYRVSTIDT